jgi:hypothetical protein
MQSRTTPYSPHCLHPPFPTCRCHPRAPAGQQQVNEEKLLFVLGCADSSSSSCLHHRELRPVAHGSAPILSALSPLTSRCGKVRGAMQWSVQIENLWKFMYGNRQQIPVPGAGLFTQATASRFSRFASFRGILGCGMARDGGGNDAGGKAPSDITNVGSGKTGGKRKSSGVLADSQVRERGRGGRARHTFAKSLPSEKLGGSLKCPPYPGQIRSVAARCC